MCILYYRFIRGNLNRALSVKEMDTNVFTGVFVCFHPIPALNMTTNSRRRENEENDSLEVVVDGDDSSTYGQAQYTESDIQSSLIAARNQSPSETSNSASFAQEHKT